MLASGGVPVNCHMPEPMGAGGENAAVVATKPPTLIEEFGPKKNPFWFISTTMPLALIDPQICDGCVSRIRFHTTETALGWWKLTDSPAPMLKLCQLMTELCEALMSRRDPFCAELTLPCCTLMPCGPPMAFKPEKPASSPVRKRPRRPVVRVPFHRRSLSQ